VTTALKSVFAVLALLTAMPAGAAEIGPLYDRAAELAGEIDATNAYCQTEDKSLSEKLTSYARTLGSDESAIADRAKRAHDAKLASLKAKSADCANLDFLIRKLDTENAFSKAFDALLRETLLKK